MPWDMQRVQPSLCSSELFLSIEITDFALYLHYYGVQWCYLPKNHPSSVIFQSTQKSGYILRIYERDSPGLGFREIGSIMPICSNTSRYTRTGGLLPSVLKICSVVWRVLRKGDVIIWSIWYSGVEKKSPTFLAWSIPFSVKLGSD